MPDRTKDPMRRPPSWRTTLPMAQASPRCEARTRRVTACQSPAMANGRCRMHGGTSTGPRTPEGLERLRAARTRHGGRSAEARKVREMLRALKAETERLVGLA